MKLVRKKYLSNCLALSAISLGIMFSSSAWSADVIGCEGWKSDAKQLYIKLGPSTSSPALKDVKHYWKAKDTDGIQAWGHTTEWELLQGINPGTVVSTHRDKMDMQGDDTQGMTPRARGHHAAVVKSSGYCTNRVFVVQDRPTVNGNTTSDGSEVVHDPIPFYATGTIDTQYATNDSLTYKWDFGDGTTSSNQNPVHSFKDAGEYDVRVTSNDGKYDSITDFVDRIWVRGPARPPVIDVEPSSCSGSFRYMRLTWRRTGTSFVVQKKVGNNWTNIYTGSNSSVRAQFWGGDYAQIRAKASDPAYGADSGWIQTGFNVAQCGGGGGDLP
ncbi:PKD domain-containing protein [Microbulbifer sp. ZKSA002]|uniref:PKD domain-containing protein n=1 Tax=Microbulbifer sp. ZKSA002 TaxID=3243388 RepID=UPI00403A075E